MLIKKIMLNKQKFKIQNSVGYNSEYDADAKLPALNI